MDCYSWTRIYVFIYPIYIYIYPTVQLLGVLQKKYGVAFIWYCDSRVCCGIIMNVTVSKTDKSVMMICNVICNVHYEIPALMMQIRHDWVNIFQHINISTYGNSICSPVNWGAHLGKKIEIVVGLSYLMPTETQWWKATEEGILTSYIAFFIFILLANCCTFWFYT